MDATLSDALAKAREALAMVMRDTAERTGNIPIFDRNHREMLRDRGLLERSVLRDIIMNLDIEKKLRSVIKLLEIASEDRINRIGPEL